jgi:hypothetical protein
MSNAEITFECEAPPQFTAGEVVGTILECAARKQEHEGREYSALSLRVRIDGQEDCGLLDVFLGTKPNIKFPAGAALNLKMIATVLGGEIISNGGQRRLVLPGSLSDLCAAAVGREVRGKLSVKNGYTNLDIKSVTG